MLLTAVSIGFLWAQNLTATYCIVTTAAVTILSVVIALTIEDMAVRAWEPLQSHARCGLASGPKTATAPAAIHIVIHIACRLFTGGYTSVHEHGESSGVCTVPRNQLCRQHHLMLLTREKRGMTTGRKVPFSTIIASLRDPGHHIAISHFGAASERRTLNRGVPQMITKRIGRPEGGVASKLVRTAIEKLAWLVLALALSWTCVSVANAKSIYVAPTGTNNAIGSLVWPVRTISQGLKLAVQGDTVIVRDGVYSELVRIGIGGTSSKPIEIVAEHKGMAIIQGTGAPLNTDLVVIAASNVRFRGFAVRDATRSGIAVWKATNVIISDTIVTGSQRSGIWVGGPGLGQSKQIQISNNTVTNNCLENMKRNWSGGWPRAIAVDVSTAVTITANIVANNYGEGIGFLSTQDGKIAGNVVFDNFSVEIYLDNSPLSTVTGNLIFSTGNTNFFRYNRPAYGILIANEDTEYPMPSKGIKATDNTLIGSGNAIYVGVDWQAKLISCTISPNTVQSSMPRTNVITLISQMVATPTVDVLSRL